MPGLSPEVLFPTTPEGWEELGRQDFENGLSRVPDGWASAHYEAGRRDAEVEERRRDTRAYSLAIGRLERAGRIRYREEAKRVG